MSSQQQQNDGRYRIVLSDDWTHHVCTMPFVVPGLFGRSLFGAKFMICQWRLSKQQHQYRSKTYAHSSLKSVCHGMKNALTVKPVLFQATVVCLWLHQENWHENSGLFSDISVWTFENYRELTSFLTAKYTHCLLPSMEEEGIKRLGVGRVNMALLFFPMHLNLETCTSQNQMKVGSLLVPWPWSPDKTAVRVLSHCSRGKRSCWNGCKTHHQLPNNCTRCDCQSMDHWLNTTLQPLHTLSLTCQQRVW